MPPARWLARGGLFLSEWPDCRVFATVANMLLNKFAELSAEKPGGVDLVRLTIDSEQSTVGDVVLVLTPELAHELGERLKWIARTIWTRQANEQGMR